MPQNDVALLTIVSLPKEKRVHCQHPDCRQTVYKRVHVIRAGGKISFVGSTCFKKLYGHHHLRPQLGTHDGQTLTPEERDAIVANTEAFINKLQADKDALDAAKQPPQPPPAPVSKTWHRPRPNHASQGVTHRTKYTCLDCSNENGQYTFVATERQCPRCHKSDNVFTLQKYDT